MSALESVWQAIDYTKFCYAIIHLSDLAEALSSQIGSQVAQGDSGTGK